jgi:(4S)-4-hydroxy-5-phosphonooxypentane-2,3-dione isomerase
MPRVILKGHVIVPAEDLDAVQRELPVHIEKTREEEGCLIFEVTQDQERENRFNVHEEFIDKESFSAHQARVQNSDWGKVSANIERHYHVNHVE